jgi:hypothetical protein
MAVRLSTCDFHSDDRWRTTGKLYFALICNYVVQNNYEMYNEYLSVLNNSYKATDAYKHPNVRHFPTYILRDIKRNAVNKIFKTKYKLLIYNRFRCKIIIKNSFGLSCRRRGVLSYEESWWPCNMIGFIIVARTGQVRELKIIRSLHLGYMHSNFYLMCFCPLPCGVWLRIF